MIGNFYKVFKSNKNERVLPAKVVAELSKNLPLGYTYKMDDKTGHLIVVPEKANNFKDLNVKLDLSAIDIPISISSEQQILEYLYRTQQKVPVLDASIGKGNKTIPFSDLTQDPITGEGREEIIDMFVIPQPFPPAVEVGFMTSDGKEKKILLRRKPYNSMNHIRITNDSFPALNIEWILPDKQEVNDEPAKVTVTANPLKADNVNDAEMAIRILKDFYNGSLRINNMKLGKSLSGISQISVESLDNKIRFWNILGKLESIINVKFKPGADFPEEDDQFLRELEIMFIEDKAIQQVPSFDHFHVGSIKFRNEEFNLTKHIGKPGLVLSFIDGPIMCTLLGTEFQLFESTILQNVEIEKVVQDQKGEGAEVYLCHRPWTLVRKYALTEREAQIQIQKLLKGNNL